jgi:hypothetical protein
MAEVAAFVASDRASAMTGTIVNMSMGSHRGLGQPARRGLRKPHTGNIYTVKKIKK